MIYVNDTSVPLIYFIVFVLLGLAPQAFAPLAWFGLNIQLHAGRSKRRVSKILSDITANAPKKSGWNDGTKASGASALVCSQQVAPTEDFASP